MRAEDPLDRTLALLHEATLDDALGLDAALQLNETCRTRGSGFALIAGSHPSDAEILFNRISLHGRRREDWERRYYEEYFVGDPRARLTLQRPPGQLLYTPEICTAREKKESAAYNVALREMEAQSGLLVRQTGPGGSHVLWALCDSLEEGWTSAQIRLIEHLRPHVRRYVCTRQQLAAAGALGTSLIEMLDNAHLGVIQLDPLGRIIAANDQARGVLGEGDGLGDAGGLLSARLPREDAKLSYLLANALPSFGAQGHAGSMLVTRLRAQTPLILHVNPVSRKRSGFQGQLAAVALIVDPSRRTGIDPAPGDVAPDPTGG